MTLGTIIIVVSYAMRKRQNQSSLRITSGALSSTIGEGLDHDKNKNLRYRNRNVPRGAVLCDRVTGDDWIRTTNGRTSGFGSSSTFDLPKAFYDAINRGGQEHQPVSDSETNMSVPMRITEEDIIGRWYGVSKGAPILILENNGKFSIDFMDENSGEYIPHVGTYAVEATHIILQSREGIEQTIQVSLVEPDVITMDITGTHKRYKRM